MKIVDIARKAGELNIDFVLENRSDKVLSYYVWLDRRYGISKSVAYTDDHTELRPKLTKRPGFSTTKQPIHIPPNGIAKVPFTFTTANGGAVPSSFGVLRSLSVQIELTHRRDEVEPYLFNFSDVPTSLPKPVPSGSAIASKTEHIIPGRCTLKIIKIENQNGALNVDTILENHSSDVMSYWLPTYSGSGSPLSQSQAYTQDFKELRAQPLKAPGYGMNNNYYQTIAPGGLAKIPFRFAGDPLTNADTQIRSLAVYFLLTHRRDELDPYVFGFQNIPIQRNRK